jgi:hypothetical protein
VVGSQPDVTSRELVGPDPLDGDAHTSDHFVIIASDGCAQLTKTPRAQLTETPRPLVPGMACSSLPMPAGQPRS